MGLKMCECGCQQPAPIAMQTNKQLGHVKGQPTRFIVGHHRRGKANKILFQDASITVIALVQSDGTVHPCTVDTEIYPSLVAPYRWNVSLFSNGRWYAVRTIQIGVKRVTEHMHRAIMGLEFGNPFQVDHKDRVSTLDNRRLNLRVTLDRNQCNVGKRKGTTSKFKGVYWATREEKWVAEIQVGGKAIRIGYFTDEVEAALAYDAAAVELHGEFACTNASLGLLDGLKKPAQSVEMEPAVAA